MMEHIYPIQPNLGHTGQNHLPNPEFCMLFERSISTFLLCSNTLLLQDREITKSLVHRAEAAGFTALVLTVDAPTFGRRLDDIRNDFKLPPHLNMANFAGQNKTTGKSGINDQVCCRVARWRTFDPFLSLDCAGREGVRRDPRKGRDHILQRSVAEP